MSFEILSYKHDIQALRRQYGRWQPGQLLRFHYYIAKLSKNKNSFEVLEQTISKTFFYIYFTIIKGMVKSTSQKNTPSCHLAHDEETENNDYTLANNKNYFQLRILSFQTYTDV